jgi:hypothetical protein
VHFFDHHGGSGHEQHVGSITFPDYEPWGGHPRDEMPPAQMAARAWQLQCHLSDFTMQGTCIAIVGGDDPQPTHGHDEPADSRFYDVWVAYRDLLNAHTNRPGSI